MRILQICLKPPLPAVDGGCKAMNNITQGLLNKGLEVKVLTLSTHKHPFVKASLSSGYIEQTKIESVFIDTEIKLKDAFLNLFSSNSYNIERFYSIEFEELIIQTLKAQNFDAILFESLYVTPYVEAVRKHSKAKLVYRAHNVEFEIWERNATIEKGAKKRYLNLLAKRLKKYEGDVLYNFDGIAAITEKDKKQLVGLGAKNINVFPFGIKLNDYKIDFSKTENSLFYIGSMDWLPNVAGIKWFLEKAWDSITKKHPKAKLNLAGRMMPEWMLNHSQEGVKIIGEVDEASDFINRNGIMIVPLFAGSGMRIKIIEAMALQKLVIATSIAVEGISCEHGKNIIIANTAKEFAEHTLHYLNNSKERDAIAKNAREFVESNYDNQVIVDNLVQFIKQL